MNNCGGALVGRLGLHWYQSIESPNPHHVSAWQAGTGFRCSRWWDRAGHPLQWPRKVMGCQGDLGLLLGEGGTVAWEEETGWQWCWEAQWMLGAYVAVPAGPSALLSRAGSPGGDC